MLAKILNKGFVDADLVIQTQCGATLQSLIDERGAQGFIKLEGEILGKLYAENSIIATGGSAIYSDEAMRHLSECGIVVYLRISYPALVKRLGDLQERGVVMRDSAGSDLFGLFEERKPYYERYAQVVVDVENLSIAEAAKKVARACQAAEGTESAIM